jgi:hypothetical protein
MMVTRRTALAVAVVAGFTPSADAAKLQPAHSSEGHSSRKYAAGSYHIACICSPLGHIVDSDDASADTTKGLQLLSND